jgi:hypothetical protein
MRECFPILIEENCFLLFPIHNFFVGEVSPSLRPGRDTFHMSICLVRDRSSATPSWVHPMRKQWQNQTPVWGHPRRAVALGTFITLFLCHFVTSFLQGHRENAVISWRLTVDSRMKKQDVIASVAKQSPVMSIAISSEHSVIAGDRLTRRGKVDFGRGNT